MSSSQPQRGRALSEPNDQPTARAPSRLLPSSRGASRLRPRAGVRGGRDVEGGRARQARTAEARISSQRAERPSRRRGPDNLDDIPQVVTILAQDGRAGSSGCTRLRCPRHGRLPPRLFLGSTAARQHGSTAARQHGSTATALLVPQPRLSPGCLFNLPTRNQESLLPAVPWPCARGRRARVAAATSFVLKLSCTGEPGVPVRDVRDSLFGCSTGRRRAAESEASEATAQQS